MVRGMEEVREFRRAPQRPYNFNWLLNVDAEFQQPVRGDPRIMRALELRRDQPPHELAADLRRAFSGIVAGNVKEYGIRADRAARPLRIRGDPESWRRSTRCSRRSSRSAA